MLKAAALAAFLTVALVLGGCSSPPTPLSDTPPDRFSGMGLPEGGVDDAVARLDDLAADLMDRSGIPGMAVAVVHGGNTVYANGFGVRNTGRDADDDDNRVDADTVFQVASLSTPIGATVVAHQIGAESINWDTPVGSYLPWFAFSDPYVSEHATIADLYAQRTGLPQNAGDLLAELGYDRRQVLLRLKELPLGAFRLSHRDTEFGVTVAAESVAVAAGKRWDELSDDVLYRPLGMESTSSRYADFTRRRDRALGHTRTDDGYRPSYHGDTDPKSAAVGVSSTVNDLGRWLAMLLADGDHDGTTLIPTDALTPALTAQTVNHGPQGSESPEARADLYGYGFHVATTSTARTTYGYEGGLASGSAAAFAALPSADVAIVVLTNAAPNGVPETLTAQFLDLVQYGELRHDWPRLYRERHAEKAEDTPGVQKARKPPRKAKPPAALRSYTGTYFNDYWGSATVTETRRGLELTLGPRRDTVVLHHWDGDTFTFTPKSDTVPDGAVSKATFTPDALTLQYYDRDRLGIFFR
ncbi:serine hydrolase [Mycolicibacillus parakoreensis]|uniref:Serine hydrolase n=1 Tax=Mycolicibacillus parakoreensis TaxID=1069221 RepID=A0ABY3U099_9MYCO|nr:serine hydrolase [Mycolicibacillus parakoreensis]MCV7315278.1 serine hydrolase [Mycolicibacillus parakoreensis]ULN53393.1 serine hydrolase [Mycolicibacillus parakoreensis]